MAGVADEEETPARVGTFELDAGLLQRTAGSPCSQGGAVAAQLVLHFACFFSNISTLVVYFVLEEWRFFGTLLAAWLLCSLLVCWAALKEFEPRGQQHYRALRWVWVVVVFGLLRGLQVRHICRFFKQRLESKRAGNRASSSVASSQDTIADGTQLRPTAFNSKTFDGIIEGFFFALGNQFAFFLTDISPPDCDWYMTQWIGHRWLRFLFLFSALLSMLSLAAAIVEVDYRVSNDVRHRINTSPWRSFVHFAYRATEVVLHLSAINLTWIFLRPLPYLQNRAGPYLLYTPVAVTWLIAVCILRSASSRHSAEEEKNVAHAAVALAAISVNPTLFVDRPVYAAAAKSTARAFFYLHWARLLAAAAVVALCWDTRFPCRSDRPPYPDRPSTIGLYTLWQHSNHRMAYCEFGLALVLHWAIVLRQPYTRQVVSSQVASSQAVSACGQGQGEPEQPPLVRATRSVFLATSFAHNREAEVNKTVPRGLSSFLVQAGTGVTSRLFVDREYAMTDFCVLRQLGCGTYGVVILVEALWRGGEPLPREQQKLYALKLTHVSGAVQAMYAAREREYLLKLNEHEHPFIMRLARFFNVPSEQHFSYPNGNPVLDGNSCGIFHKALMMEYCPMGSLEAYLQSNAVEAPGSAEPPQLREDDQWLDEARRICAQLMEAVRFLHGENFVHRDLKPDNVLLKNGRHGKHICLTDFGFAKQPGEGDALKSVAGTGGYMAPEIRRIYLGERADEDEITYTKACDLWSLGKTILVVLWGAKALRRPPFDGSYELLIPKAAWVNGPDGHPRVPAFAWQLVDQMMKDEAAGRGEAAGLAKHRFFGTFEHRGKSLPLLDFSNCQGRY